MQVVLHTTLCCFLFFCFWLQFILVEGKSYFEWFRYESFRYDAQIKVFFFSFSFGCDVENDKFMYQYGSALHGWRSFFSSSLFLLIFNWPLSPSFSLDIMFHTCTCNLRDRWHFASTNAKGKGWTKMKALVHDDGVDTFFFLSNGR